MGHEVNGNAYRDESDVHLYLNKVTMFVEWFPDMSFPSLLFYGYLSHSRNTIL